MSGAGGPPQRRAGPEHAWVWAALPADCERVAVPGDPALASLLGDGGGGDLERESQGAAPVDALVFDGDLDRGRLDPALSRLRRGGTVAAAVGDARPPGGRAARLARTFGARLRVPARARDWEHALSGAGLATTRIPTGERWRAHRLGGRRPLAAGAVVVGHSGPRPRTVLEAAVEAASEHLGEPLRAGTVSVRGSGTLLVGSRSEDRRFLLRIAGGPAGRMLETSIANLRTLARAAPPAVSEKLVLPVAEGDVGRARYALEPLVDGGAPRRVGGRQREDAVAFLAALGSMRSPDAGAAAGLEADALVLEPHLSESEGGALGSAVSELRDRIAALPAVWGHGDFWPGNLLVRRGRLVAVIDWDAASPVAPPLLDLFHLFLMRTPRLRRLSHGRRCTDVLWPLLRSGGDERLRAFCERTAAPADPATLTALGVTYWLTRSARDLREFEDRPSRPRWMAENVHRPLAALAGT